MCKDGNDYIAYNIQYQTYAFYFNIISFNINFRNRITRNKLLDESRSIEMKQNKRVRDFIRKLNLDEEEVRVLAETVRHVDDSIG